MAKNSDNMFLAVVVYLIYGADCVISECCRGSNTVLDCSHCGLTVFPSDALSNKTAVTSLDLSNNNISHIPDGSFKHLTSLKKLVLIDNPILSYNKEIFEGKLISYPSSLKCRGINFFRGQGGMKAGINRHSRTFLWLCPISF